MPILLRTGGYRALDARHLHWMFTTTHMANYTPLAWLSYALDYKVWGLDPVGYHLTNLLLHAANAVLFYFLAVPLLGRALPRAARGSIELGAAVAAAAFALSPLRVESVAWASERRDVLSGFFYLAALLSYVKAAAADGRRRAALFSLSVACFTGAALSKASVVPLPAALLALDYYPLKRRWTRAVLTEKIPYAAIAAAAAFMAVRAQLLSGGFTALARHGAAGRLAQALIGAAFYIEKTAVPADLHALYPLPLRLSLLSLRVLASAAALAACVGVLAALGVEKKAQLSLWGYYLALLLPVLGLLQNGAQLVALRYSYLSCLGWALLAGAAAARAGYAWNMDRARSAAVLAALGLWLAANAWAAQDQMRVWRDDKTLWADVLERFPSSPDANANMASALVREKDYPAAEARARASLDAAPDNSTALIALAMALGQDDRRPEARAALERGLQERPDWGDAHGLLGVYLALDGADAEALTHLERAAELKPTSAEAQENAGILLAQHGRYAEALPYFEKAALIDPEDSVVRARLDRVRGDLGKSRPKP